LGNGGRPDGFDFQRQKSRNPLALPTNEGIRLDIPQDVAPRKHSTQGRHQPTGGVVRPSWFELPLLVERQLFAEEEVLRGKGAVGADREGKKLAQIEHDRRQAEEAVLDSCCRHGQDGHERSGSHVTERYDSLIRPTADISADNTLLSQPDKQKPANWKDVIFNTGDLISIHYYQ
jgi:hypothetical protein